MRPHRPQPTRLRHPWDSPGKNAEVGCHFLLQRRKVKSESEVTQSCPWGHKELDRTMQLSEKAMALHSSTLAWRIPWTEEPGRLQSKGSLSRTRLSDFTFTFMHWRRQWQPTPVFLPGESQGWRSLVGCGLWGRTELDTTEAT